MKLNLKNIGKIQNANIELNGITVIAGENNTGKSTVGKVLYSIFNSLYHIKDQIFNERVQSIRSSISSLYYEITDRFTARLDENEIAEDIVNNIDKYSSNTELLQKDLIEFIMQYDANFEKYISKSHSSIKDAVEEIIDIINISDEDIFKVVINKYLDTEFYGQINNIFTEKEGYVSLTIKNQSVSFSILDNTVMNINNQLDLKTEVIYIDDPFILDEVVGPFFRRRTYLAHRDHLKRKLLNSNDKDNILKEIITTNKLDNITSKLNAVCNGNIVRKTRNGLGYTQTNKDKILNINNISVGLKSFVILKTLLQTGILEYNGTIILDEPEIHLHPQWQMVFAEIIVLIQKEFNMHILLNTHSPYFLKAIEVYASKYEVADKCKYYLSEMTDEFATIYDVTDEIEKIYKKLARPLQDLENVRYDND